MVAVLGDSPVSPDVSCKMDKLVSDDAVRMASLPAGNQVSLLLPAVQNRAITAGEEWNTVQPSQVTKNPGKSPTDYYDLTVHSALRLKTTT